MSTRIWKVVRAVIFVWGVVSLLGAITFGGFLCYQFGPGNRDKDDSASTRDVRFVLNWSGLGDQRIEKVLHSHVSSRSLTGDHLDAYAIKISHIDVAELPLTSKHRQWYRGDQVPQVLDDALHFVGGALHELPWFPREMQLRSADFYVYPWGIQLHGTRPSGVQLIFVRPADQTVFYFDSQI